MDIQHTFSNTFPQQKKQHRRARKKRGHHDTNLVDRIHKLPQELVDMIEGYFLETIFCPGYFLPQIHHQASHTWNAETRPIARPDMLRLNREIYRKYRLRIWTENTCVVKTGGSRKYLEMIPVLGHREDPWSYLIEQCTQHSPSLAAELTFQQSRENGTSLHEDNENDTPTEPLRNTLDLFCAGVVKRLLGKLSEMSLSEMSVMKIPLLFTDRYDAAGAWGGIELPEDITMLPVRRHIHLQKHARILWKAFTFMAGRRKECHREAVPLMAKRSNPIKPALIVVQNRIYVFP
ncbi:MAG: hypothetical protein L6R36_006359 [Xanthoria steineri]|nr:MAG: hypothetical protein L6R36_006359 [Xanthoria steineri]